MRGEYALEIRRGLGRLYILMGTSEVVDTSMVVDWHGFGGLYTRLVTALESVSGERKFGYLPTMVASYLDEL